VNFRVKEPVNGEEGERTDDPSAIDTVGPQEDEH